MKPITILNNAPVGLRQYLAEAPQNPSWQNFRDQAGNSYNQLRDALARLQHGLCGYCEQRIPVDDTQIEHVIPRSADTNGNHHELDHTNMIACCKGGTAVNTYGPKTIQHDNDRVGDESCGQAKGNTQDELLLDPRNLPILRSLFRVRPNGKIEANPEACYATGISEASVNRTIAILGLDVGRLRSARSKKWADINEAYKDFLHDETVMRLAAKAELFPNNGGTLPKFFTTTRSYFQHYADSVLAGGDCTWV